MNRPNPSFRTLAHLNLRKQHFEQVLAVHPFQDLKTNSSEQQTKACRLKIAQDEVLKKLEQQFQTTVLTIV